MAKANTNYIDLLRKKATPSLPALEEHELAPQEDPDADAHDLGEILVDRELNYYMRRRGDYHVVKLNVMGEPHIHERVSPQSVPGELYTPIKWGRAYDGPAETAYPIPQEYTFTT